MATGKRAKAGDPPRKDARKRARRGGERRSMNLSVCVEHHRLFRGLAVLLDREPSELLMDWVEERAKGMRFSLPGGKSAEIEGTPPGAGEGLEGGAGKAAGPRLAG